MTLEEFAVVISQRAETRWLSIRYFWIQLFVSSVYYTLLNKKYSLFTVLSTFKIFCCESLSKTVFLLRLWRGGWTSCIFSYGSPFPLTTLNNSAIFLWNCTPFFPRELCCMLFSRCRRYLIIIVRLTRFVNFSILWKSSSNSATTNTSLEMLMQTYLLLGL